MAPHQFGGHSRKLVQQPCLLGFQFFIPPHMFCFPFPSFLNPPSSLMCTILLQLGILFMQSANLSMHLSTLPLVHARKHHDSMPVLASHRHSKASHYDLPSSTYVRLECVSHVISNRLLVH